MNHDHQEKSESSFESLNQNKYDDFQENSVNRSPFFSYIYENKSANKIHHETE